MKHYNIPVFIPELACPNQCIYCNQRHISGQLQVVKPEEVKQIIEQHLATFIKPSHVELAFFGGSFTGIEEKDMITNAILTGSVFEVNKALKNIQKEIKNHERHLSHQPSALC